jgi:hypothetical protein
VIIPSFYPNASRVLRQDLYLAFSGKEGFHLSKARSVLSAAEGRADTSESAAGIPREMVLMDLVTHQKEMGPCP